jgi:hypothetical protein
VKLATGLLLRHDYGSVFLSEVFQDELDLTNRYNEHRARWIIERHG